MDNYDMIIAVANIAAKELNFPLPELYLIEIDKLPNKEITGVYSFKDDMVKFNESWVKNSHWTEVAIIVFHELRHAYQGYCIMNKTRETNEVLTKWEYEMNNYIMPSGKNNEINDRDYLNQSIEIDAIYFSHKMMLDYFNLKTIIPNIIFKEVLK